MKKETFTCLHCKKVCTKVRYEKSHGDNCSKKIKVTVRSNTLMSAIDINKYVDLHEEFVSVIGEYYNHHIGFINKPSEWTSRFLVFDLMKISRLIKRMKANNLASRKQLASAYNEIKKQRKEENLRKQNGNNSNN